MLKDVIHFTDADYQQLHNVEIFIGALFRARSTTCPAFLQSLKDEVDMLYKKYEQEPPL